MVRTLHVVGAMAGVHNREAPHVLAVPLVYMGHFYNISHVQQDDSILQMALDWHSSRWHLSCNRHSGA